MYTEAQKSLRIQFFTFLEKSRSYHNDQPNIAYETSIKLLLSRIQQHNHQYKISR